MKICPFCKAQIEDNASFCFYCMKSLENKEAVERKVKQKGKRVIPVIIPLLILIIAGAVLLFLNSCKNTSSSQNISSDDEASSLQEAEVTENDNEESMNKAETESKEETKPDRDFIISDELDSGSQNSEDSNTSLNRPLPPSDDYENSVDYPTEVPESNNQDSDSSSEGNSDSNTDFDDSFPLNATAVYSYRRAIRGDDFSANYQFSENDIIITGVISASDSGVYVIPEYIDGKTVVAIDSLSFSDDSIRKTVREVLIPPTVLTVWENSFYGCENLSDVYLCPERIFVDINAFTLASSRKGTLTIHCSDTCTDRNLRYYKNTASLYGAVYEEWEYVR